MAKSEDQDPHNHVEPARDEECNPPGSERGCTCSLYDLVDDRHQQLRGSSAHVSPASGRAVGQPDDFAVEHGAHPVLARHKRGEREPDHEPHGNVTPGGGHEGHAEHGGSREHDQERAAVPGTQQVADRAHDEPGQNAAGNRGHSGVPDVALGEVEVVADDGYQRGGGEGGDEASEEGDPGEVESPHVGVGEGEELEDLGLVLRINGQVELGGRVRWDNG